MIRGMFRIPINDKTAIDAMDKIKMSLEGINSDLSVEAPVVSLVTLLKYESTNANKNTKNGRLNSLCAIQGLS
jgi:hypothetical protein